jgi:hypothetical protein
VKIDGKQYDLVCLFRADAGPGGTYDCLLFDSASGRFAGSSAPGQNLVLTDENVLLVDFGTQPRPVPAVRPSMPPPGPNATLTVKPKK